jgi:S1-C subfamily serine protease
VSAIAKEVDPAVVDVNVTFNYEGAAGAGTGIVLTSNGLVLTNNHVIDGATKISVTDVGNGKTYSATVLGYDNTHDVALIKLQGASGLKTAKVASSSASIGQAVVAIGNAGGLGGTPTSAGGSVTALGQNITASDSLDGTNEQLSNLIEVNANVESGDSGGPLVNASGQVIGMDTAASQSFSFSASGNQGFAIPISQALKIAKQIESGSGDSVVHVGATAFLGVMVQAQQASYGAVGGPSTQGAQICAEYEYQCVVSGSPAAKVGLQPGDVITGFAGHTVSSSSALTHDLVAFHPGQSVKITWVDTTGQTHSGTVTLASGPPA